MPRPFAHPFTYWVGMETDPRTTAEALAEFNRFYSTTHVGEVVAAHAGFVSGTRYELVETDSRDGEHFGPRWLAVYGMQDQAAAEQYVKDNARPWLHRRQYSPWPPARKRAKIVWRLLWRCLSSAGVADDAPSDTVFLLGSNVPPSSDNGSLADLELYREFAYPAPGCPRFCAIYLTPAPASLQHQDAVWRLTYIGMPPPAPVPA